MPDNTTEIAEIREILASGVSQMSNDGTSISHNLTELRKTLRILIASDTATVTSKRPSSFQLDLGGF